MDFSQVVEELVFPQKGLGAGLTAKWCCGTVHSLYVPLLFVLAMKCFEAVGEITGYAAGKCYALFTS